MLLPISCYIQEEKGKWGPQNIIDIKTNFNDVILLLDNNA